MSRFITLIIFIVVLQAVGYFIGTVFSADEWYQVLDKPFFNPPAWIFGVVWPVLYLLVAVAGWRVFVSGGTKPGWGLWVAQLLMNWAWSPVFFGLHMIFWAMVLIFATLVVSIAFTAANWNRDRLAALCFVPYVAWLAFALLLNLSIWLLN